MPTRTCQSESGVGLEPARPADWLPEWQNGPGGGSEKSHRPGDPDDDQSARDSAAPEPCLHNVRSVFVRDVHLDSLAMNVDPHPHHRGSPDHERRNVVVPVDQLRHAQRHPLRPRRRKLAQDSRLLHWRSPSRERLAQCCPDRVCLRRVHHPNDESSRRIPIDTREATRDRPTDALERVLVRATAEQRCDGVSRDRPCNRVATPKGAERRDRRRLDVLSPAPGQHREEEEAYRP